MALGWRWWRAWVPVDAVDAAAPCVAGAALGDMDRHFAWQAWHLATSTFTLRGVDAVDTPALCVAGVALGDIDVHFAWQVWHLKLWHWTGSGGALGRLFEWQARHLATSTVTLRGRCGTSRHRPSLCVAGVALRDIDRHLRGRRGTYGTGLALVALCSRLAPWAPPLFHAGVALGDIDRHFASQAWHFATSTSTLRGWCGTYGTGLALVVHRTLHNFVTDSFHTQLWHTSLSHTSLSHTTLSHTQNSFTHNSVTHNSFTHNFVT